MAQLLRANDHQLLLPRLRVAKDLRARMKGLLGTSAIGADEGLWIHQCNWIHMFFMRYPIDVIYLDKALEVRRVDANVGTWTMGLPCFTASTVVELRAGRAAELNIRKGDRLHVGT